jgi:MoaC family
MDAVEEVRRRQVTETTTQDTPDYRQEEAVEQKCTSFPPKSLHTQLHQYNIPEEELLFSHVDAGNAVTMVDVGSKQVSRRTARAQSQVVFPPEVMAAFELRGEELIGPKGPIFATAKLAGIMAAK